MCVLSSTRADIHHAHHLVVLMREDMAVPDVAARFVECGLDAGDLSGEGGDHVLGRILDIPLGLR